MWSVSRESEAQLILGAVASLVWVMGALVAEALVTSRSCEPPCWLVIRRILADVVFPFFPFPVGVSALPSSASLRADLAGGILMDEGGGWGKRVETGGSGRIW